MENGWDSRVGFWIEINSKTGAVGEGVEIALSICTIRRRRIFKGVSLMTCNKGRECSRKD